MITEKQISSLTNVDLKYKKNNYPIPNNPFLPRAYFVSLFIGARSSGKTYSCVQLLKQYERCGFTKDGQDIPQRIILFSPTIQANPIFTSLKYLNENDIYTRYSDKQLIKVIQEIENDKKEIDKYKEDMKIYNKFLKKKKLTHEEMMDLEKRDFEEPEKPECGYVEHPVIMMIMDDLVGTDAFKAVGKSALTNLTLKNRHLSINLMILAQNLKSIPKSIRINTSLFVIFKFANKKAIIDVYEEVQNVLSENEFENLLDFATREKHDSLVVDFTSDDSLRFKRNWDTILIL